MCPNRTLKHAAPTCSRSGEKIAPVFPEKAQKVARLSRNSYLQNRLKKLTVDNFEYIDLVSKSKASQEDIDALAAEAKAGWWARNKERFKDLPGFEDITT